MDRPENPADRRAAQTAEIAQKTGIDEPMIEKLVHAFYAQIAKDKLLGPIFNSRIENWDTHLERMCAFWSSVALASGRYQGRPMEKHLMLPVDAVHFDHWLALFEETAREICPPVAAYHFIESAHRIAQSLELGIAGQHGVMLCTGERFRLNDTASSE